MSEKEEQKEKQMSELCPCQDYYTIDNDVLFCPKCKHICVHMHDVLKIKKR